MKLFFLRHGEAGRAVHDDMRALTETGREEVSLVTRQCQPMLSGLNRYW